MTSRAWPGCAKATWPCCSPRPGWRRPRSGALTVRVRHASFEQWWERFTLGVGPSGDYVATLTQDQRDELRERCRRLLPDGPVEISATAWAATARPAPARAP